MSTSCALSASSRCCVAWPLFSLPCPGTVSASAPCYTVINFRKEPQGIETLYLYVLITVCRKKHFCLRVFLSLTLFFHPCYYFQLLCERRVPKVPTTSRLLLANFPVCLVVVDSRKAESNILLR